MCASAADALRRNWSTGVRHIKIRIPDNVRKIIAAFEGAGYEACAVGGCVRDALLGREPQDWDIATSARPEETKALFRRTVDTGIKHGTVTVLLGSDAYEVTTYRVDGAYEDGRHPKSVTFTPSLREDLARRDFTINAMAYSDSLGLVDLFGGMDDLRAGVIRCVGVPEERFGEDALRILRALRFSAQLGFTIDPATEAAVVRLAPTLEKISAERIREEMTKLLVSDDPGKVRKLYETGITRVILPEFDVLMETEQDGRYHLFNVGEHTIRVIEHVSADPVMRWTALLHDIGKPRSRQIDEMKGRIHFKGHGPAGAKLAEEILRRLKFDNATIETAVKLIRWHVMRFERGEYDIRWCLNEIGPERFPLLMELQRADAYGKKPETLSDSLARCDRVERMCDEILARGDCFRMSDLAVKGADLIEAGMAPGPEMGEILGRMLEDVLNEPSHNDKEYLMRIYT